MIYRGIDRKTRHKLAVDSLKMVGLEKKASIISQMKCREDSSRESPLRGQLQRSLRSYWQMSPPEIWIPHPAGNFGYFEGNAQNRKTVILITHDNGIAAQARRVVRIMDGRIESDTINEDFDSEEENE